MMTTAVAFDTHKFVRRLRDAGVEERQAEAFSDAFREVQESQLEELATKSDITRLESGLKGEIAELRGEIGDLRDDVEGLQGELQEIRGEIKEIRGEFGELRGEFGELRGEFKDVKVEIKRLEESTKRDIKEFRLEIEARLTLIKWMFGFLLAGVLSIVLKLFLPS
ncbi:MAG: DUF1640 domain-containing protein [Magnetococcales bacterium]|nr:DUF1640 domain-containing protein [Magnetococcales bacterium]